MSKLLLVSLLAFSTAAFGDVVKDSARTTPPDASIAVPANPFAGMPKGLDPFGGNQASVSEQDHVCLRIHAFIFKTNDDRVPQFMRETTCMPASGPVLKKANGNGQPKLVPATGGNSF